MYCLTNLNLLSLQFDPIPYNWFNRRVLGGDRSGNFFSNKVFIYTFSAFLLIFTSGKEAKRMNGSLLSFATATLPSALSSSSSALLPSSFTSFSRNSQKDEEKDGKKFAGFYRDLNKQLEMPKQTESSSTSVLQFQNSYDKINSPHLSKLSNLKNNKATQETIKRERRQIVPLPKPKTRPQISSWNDLSYDVKQMIRLYKLFLVEYAHAREWSSAQFLVPNDPLGLSICENFNNHLLLSKASFHFKCVNESSFKVFPSDGARFSHNNPIIIADFITNKRNNSSGQLINPHLLINYSPERPILLLAGNENIRDVVERNEPESLNNYKWTLVRLRNKTSQTDKVIEENVELYEVVGFASSSKSLYHLIGWWTLNDGLNIDESSVVYSFGGRRIRVTTISGPPLVNLQDRLIRTSGRHSLKATGYLPDLLDMVALVLNFTYSIITPEDGKFGERGESGNWSGMVGMLQRNEADIALMSISYTKSRRSVMDYSPPVEYSATRLLVRIDWKPAELKWDAFIRPFEWKVWVTILILICLGTITLVVIANFKLFIGSPGQSMWLLSACFLLQGQSEHSTIRVTPYRIAVGTFWALAVFIFACYTARLTAFLAADTDKTPVKDFGEALRSVSWKIGLVKGSSFLEKVKESDDKEMALLWKHIQHDPSVLVGGISDGVSKVYKERYIFFTSELVPKFLIRGNCSYAWLPGKYFPGFGSLGYQNNLPYASGISHVIAQLRETGLMRRTFKKWWGISAGCSTRKGKESFLAISLNEAGSAFFILALGASLAIILALIEYTISTPRCNPQRRNLLLQIYPHEEFAAPIVHGTIASLLPTILEEDKSFVWSVRDNRFP